MRRDARREALRRKRQPWPTNDKAHRQVGFEGQGTADSGDFDAIDCSCLDKSRATLAAALARRGFELNATDRGTYLVTRWNLVRELSTLAEVGAMLRQIEGRHG
jgi:hypothetical protein